MSLPSNRIVPFSMLNRLPMQLSSVDFPAPFWPRMQKTSPSLMVKDMSLKTGVPFVYEKAMLFTSSFKTIQPFA
jgi:hypothetical protein